MAPYRSVMGDAMTIEQSDVVAAGAAEAPRRRLFGLQYLRAIAAIGVVIFHVGERAGISFRYGAWGVDLFFVLSGFLMIAITDGGVGPWAFFKDRFLRVVPLYWIATACMIAISLISVWLGNVPALGRIVASFAFIPYGDGRVALPLLPVGWTLNLEMLFYTIFTLLLFLPRYRMTVLTCALLGLVVTGLLFRSVGNPLAAWSHPIILEFAAGGWVGLAWIRPYQRYRILGFLLVAMLVWLFTLPVGMKGSIVTLMLMAVLFFETRDGGVPKWRPLLLLGDASYSIYLWQVFPLLACFTVGDHFGVPTVITALAAFATMIVGGIAAYFLLERPLLRILHRRRTRRGITVPAGP